MDDPEDRCSEMRQRLQSDRQRWPIEGHRGRFSDQEIEDIDESSRFRAPVIMKFCGGKAKRKCFDPSRPFGGPESPRVCRLERFRIRLKRAIRF
jgi:hypothetical protein